MGVAVAVGIDALDEEDRAVGAAQLAEPGSGRERARRSRRAGPGAGNGALGAEVRVVLPSLFPPRGEQKEHGDHRPSLVR